MDWHLSPIIREPLPNDIEVSRANWAEVEPIVKLLEDALVKCSSGQLIIAYPRRIGSEPKWLEDFNEALAKLRVDSKKFAVVPFYILQEDQEKRRYTSVQRDHAKLLKPRRYALAVSYGFFQDKEVFIFDDILELGGTITPIISTITSQRGRIVGIGNTNFGAKRISPDTTITSLFKEYANNEYDNIIEMLQAFGISNLSCLTILEFEALFCTERTNPIKRPEFKPLYDIITDLRLTLRELRDSSNQNVFAPDNTNTQWLNFVIQQRALARTMDPIQP